MRSDDSWRDAVRAGDRPNIKRPLKPIGDACHDVDGALGRECLSPIGEDAGVADKDAVG